MMRNYKNWNFIGKPNTLLQGKQGLKKLWLDIRGVWKIENYKIKKN